ncbi:MAG: cytidylate kinase-like family protein [Lachnospiraceae bacterium]|nr:cytidylate kinase-like family protein [Lachnospiraceae bacterium]
MKGKVITIGRQYGSGGREIGEKLAAKLGVPFHDKSIIERIVKEKGYCSEVIEQFDEKKPQSLIFSLAMNSYGNWYANDDYRPLQASVLKAQADVIKELAKEPCVIIGRAADSILESGQFTSVFIKASDKNRIARIMQRQNCSAKDAEKAMNATDRDRARFYQYYSDKKWGSAKTYDVTVDSGVLGIDKTVELLMTFIKLLKE